MSKFFLPFVLFLLFIGFSSSGVVAKSYALLVGVSDYDESIGLSDLRGPQNDVILLRDVLQARDAFEITILADGVENAARPTRDAILGALDDLVGTASDGDFVYVHMSGHGTQQADRSGDETDGLDEVFLPADTMRAEPGSAVIPNAIVDEELGQRIRALRSKGVDVWFVLDSCHSGSGLRAALPRSQARYVDPATLGLSLSGTAQPATTAAVEGPGDDSLPGRYLAFYAAQSSEVAREIEIDETAENGWYGLFTSRLAARLQSDPKLSYRQLFQAVMADMDDAAIPGGARLQTPLWAGNLMDAPVFGGGDLVGVRQFAVDGNRVQAGLLHGLTANSVLALVEDAAAGSDQILGFAQIDDLDARSARLNAVADSCVAERDAPCPHSGAVPDAARFARLVAKPRDAVVRIAPPMLLSTGAPAPTDHPLARALEQAVQDSNAEYATNIELDAGAEVLSGIHDGALWFGQKLLVGDTPVGLQWRPEGPELKTLLLRIAKAEGMARTFGSVAGTPSLLFPSPVKVQVQRLVAEPAMIQPATPDDLRSECRAAQGAGSLSTELPQGQSVKQCDQLAFGAQGVVQGPARDVNRIYVDSQFCMYVDYQRVEGTSQPAVLGGPITLCSDCPVGNTVERQAGFERLFVVVTEAQDRQEALNLEGLLENCFPDGSAGATRSANATAAAEVDGFLAGLSRGDPTRGGMGDIGISKIWVEEFNWQLLPRAQARAQAGLAANN